MSERESWLHVKVAGMDLLLATQDLREVVAAAPVAPLPGHPRGIQGVVFYQGEFLPVLAWEELPGSLRPSGEAVALAVLRPRLGLPIERLIGTLDPPPEAWSEAEEGDGMPWLGRVCRVDGLQLRAVDPVRLISLLRHFRGAR